MIRTAALVLVGLIAASGCSAAPLGKRYASYVSMHRSTEYGSLFLNEGSATLEQSRARKRFVTVTASGDVTIPSQRAYCFVFNHYDSPTGNDTIKRTYRANIKKVFANGTETLEPFEGTYTPTKKLWSTDAPDLCVRGLRDVKKLSLEFSANDGKYFDWTIAFETK